MQNIPGRPKCISCGHEIKVEWQSQGWMHEECRDKRRAKESV
jgi:hypothetical protein